MDRLSRGAFLAGVASSLPAAALGMPPFPNAYVFCRPGGAITAAGVFGHVGFAFATEGYKYGVGSVENAHNILSPAGKDYWFVETANPLERAGAWDNVRVGFQTRYDYFKRLTAPIPNVAAARRAADAIQSWPFRAPGKDCLDAVRFVLHEYGVPMTHQQRFVTVGPNAFFDSLPGSPIAIDVPWPGAAIDASLYTLFNRRGIRDDLVSPSATLADDDISYDPTGDRPQIPWSSVVVRRGMLALYSEPGFTGDVHVMRPYDFLNSQDLSGWPSIGSYVLHDGEFDPRNPPLDGLGSRFANRATRSTYYDDLQRQP